MALYNEYILVSNSIHLNHEMVEGVEGGGLISPSPDLGRMKMIFLDNFFFREIA